MISERIYKILKDTELVAETTPGYVPLTWSIFFLV
jgi:hypothetical protein